MGNLDPAAETLEQVCEDLMEAGRWVDKDELGVRDDCEDMWSV